MTDPSEATAALAHQRGHNREARFLCANAARDRDDSPAATAPGTRGWLLIAHPGGWDQDALASTLGFDLAVAVVSRARDDGLRVAMLRRPGRAHQDEPRRWFRVDLHTHEMRTGVVSDDVELLDAPFPDGAGEPHPEPLVLVCTHGRHDTCCAVRGRPVAAALAELAPDDVWECSHLGGDRFAANVLALPDGDMYGFCGPDDAPELLGAARGGAVPARLWRGRGTVPQAGQAALRELGLSGVALRSVDMLDVHAVPDRDADGRPVTPGTWTVTATVDGRPQRSRVTESSSERELRTCQATAPARVRLWSVGPWESAEV